MSYKALYDIDARGSLHRKNSKIIFFHLRRSLLYVHFFTLVHHGMTNHVVIGELHVAPDCFQHDVGIIDCKNVYGLAMVDI